MLSKISKINRGFLMKKYLQIFLKLSYIISLPWDGTVHIPNDLKWDDFTQKSIRILPITNFKAICDYKFYLYLAELSWPMGDSSEIPVSS